MAAALKPIYTAATAEQAEQELAEFEAQWGSRYPMIGRSWRNNWARVIPFFQFPEEIRRVIYTTNAVESLNYSLRKIIKNRSLFPNDEAVFKLLSRFGFRCPTRRLTRGFRSTTSSGFFVAVGSLDDLWLLTRSASPSIRDNRWESPSGFSLSLSSPAIISAAICSHSDVRTHCLKSYSA